MEVLYIIVGILLTSVFFLIRENKIRYSTNKMISDLSNFKQKILSDFENFQNVVDDVFGDYNDMLTSQEDTLNSTIENMYKDIRDQFDENMSFRDEIWGILETEEIGNITEENEILDISENEIDNILIKISNTGINSLTKEELELLKSVSNKNK